MAPRLDFRDGASTTLYAALTASATSMVVKSSTLFGTAPYLLVVEPDTDQMEKVEVSAVSNEANGLYSTLTVSRAKAGTIAKVHPIDSVVKMIFGYGHHKELLTYFFVSARVTGSTSAAVDQRIFTAPRACRVESISAILDAVSAATAAATVYKCPSGIALTTTGSADLLGSTKIATVTGTSDVNTKTAQTPALTATDASLILAAGDSLMVDIAQNTSTAAIVVVTIKLSELNLS
jgi:hypothetical protein